MSIIRRLSGMAGAVAAAVPVFLALPTEGYAQIEEITVTARRREESLQDVPLSVTAFGAQQIERQGITNLFDIANLDPSIQFDTSFGPADTRVTIRGLSNTRGRANVAFLIDGIDVTTENLNAAGSGLLANRRLLNDVERIEVVKGPQSALYGRAAFSGAISYITKNPAEEFEGQVGWELGDYGTKQFNFALSGPLIDGILGMRLSGVWYEDDGFYKNSISGQSVGDAEGYGYAWTTVFTPTDELRFKLRAEYSKENASPMANVRIGGGRQGYNLALFEYPQDALAAGIGMNASLNSTSTALINFGQYCPAELLDPDRGPGICLPTTMGSGKGKLVTHSEDPLTGKDYAGTELETFRIALETTLDVGVGMLTSYTGWVDFKGSDAYDQDWQAVGRPDSLGLPPNSPLLVPGTNQGFGMQTSRSTTDTKQFSQELRFATSLEGPLQFTAGALYWTEQRGLDDASVIIFCTLTRRESLGIAPEGIYGPGGLIATQGGGQPSFCDGMNGTLDNYQDFYRQLQPQTPGRWQADTRSWSFYGLAEWEITDAWTLSFESRFVSENFTLNKPNQSSCTQFFGPNPGGLTIIGSTNDPNQICSTDFVFDPNFPLQQVPPAVSGTQGYRINRGSLRSRYSTPKVVLTWSPTTDMRYYFSWAQGQKPGGIAGTPGGGSPTSVAEDRFEPEKLTAWELGAKTDWRLAGFLRLNGALFFQDYTDKQIGTQVERDGFLKPVIINASAAEVWGLELEAVWLPELVDGLTLRAAWTYLDATFSDYVEETPSLRRATEFGRDCNVVFRGNPGQPFCSLDFSGNQLERTPKNSFVTGANLTRPFLDSSFDWFVELNTIFQTKRFNQVENGIYFEEYWLVDTRFGLLGDRWDILVFIDNLFDDRTIKTGGSGPDFGAQVVELGFSAGLGQSHYFGGLPDPRVIGVRANYRFGAGY